MACWWAVVGVHPSDFAATQSATQTNHQRINPNTTKAGSENQKHHLFTTRGYFGDRNTGHYYDYMGDGMKAWITNHAYKQLTRSGKASCKVQLHALDDDVSRVEIEIPDPQPTLAEAAHAVLMTCRVPGQPAQVENSKLDDLAAALEREPK